MERHRGHSLMYRTPKTIPTSEGSPLLSHKARKIIKANFSIGKSLKNIITNERIISIKERCLEKSMQKKEESKQKMKNSNLKNYSQGDEDLDLSMSDNMSDETDDAMIECQEWTGSVLLKSKFKGRNPTIFFRYPMCCEISRIKNQSSYSPRLQKVQKIDLRYRIYGSEYKCILNAFESNGYVRSDNTKNWDVFFDVRGSKARRTYSSMIEGQRFNHFAGCWSLGRKDELWRGIQKLRRIFPEDYNYLPKTYIFPYDYERFETAREIASKDQLWIQKPVASACGRNIKLISKDSKVKKKRQILISEYISPPHLINGYKYDLRIYVLVTSFNPLRIYIYQDGLVRFATQQYTTKCINKKFIHLTNFSVNKKSNNFVFNKNTDNPSQKHQSKWSLLQLKQHYEKVGICYENIFKQIEDIVIKTCISAEPSMLAPKFRHEEKRNCGFELFGFDILIDEKLKAWLMEVNVCPSLCSSSPFDRKIKHTLIVDLLNLLGVKPPANRSAESPKLEKKEELSRKYRFKNPHSILNLSYQNCLELLSPEDWLILFESDEQLDRMSLGNFRRVFPRKESVFLYQNFFECARYNNLVLWKHLLSGKGFLSRINL